MGDGQLHLRHIIGLDDREAGAWRLSFKTKPLQYAARERRLTRAKAALQRNDVSDARHVSQTAAEHQHRRFVGHGQALLSHGVARSPPWCPAPAPTRAGGCRHAPRPIAWRAAGLSRPFRRCAPVPPAPPHQRSWLDAAH